MESITNETLHRLKDSIDCLDLVERMGMDVHGRCSKHFICCVLHSEDTPSMQINRDFLYCHGCHKSLDAIDFYKTVKGCSWAEAVRDLGLMYGVSIDTEHAQNKKVLYITKEALELIDIHDFSKAKAFYEEDSAGFREYAKIRSKSALERIDEVIGRLSLLKSEKAQKAISVAENAKKKIEEVGANCCAEFDLIFKF